MMASPRLLPLLLSVLMGALTLSARAQSDSQGTISIDKIDVDLVEAPVFGVSNLPPANFPQKPGKWLEIDFSYNVNSDRQILNEVQFRAYVEVQDLATPADKEGPPAVLIGETTVTSVPNGKNTGSFFIHPFNLNRFGGERAAADYKQPKGKNIRIEAYIDGQQVSVKDRRDDDPNWVGQMKKLPGMVVPRDQSPWALINCDRFPPAKLRSSGGNP